MLCSIYGILLFSLNQKLLLLFAKFVWTRRDIEPRTISCFQGPFSLAYLHIVVVFFTNDTVLHDFRLYGRVVSCRNCFVKDGLLFVWRLLASTFRQGCWLDFVYYRVWLNNFRLFLSDTFQRTACALGTCVWNWLLCNIFFKVLAVIFLTFLCNEFFNNLWAAVFHVWFLLWLRPFALNSLLLRLLSWNFAVPFCVNCD